MDFAGVNFKPKSARGLIWESIGRGEVSFVLLKLAFQSTIGEQVCNFVLVPKKTV